MAYSNNPKLPAVRREAVRLVRKGWSMRKVARHLGYHHTAVMKWVKRAPSDGRRVISTLSSRPKTSPRSIPREVVGQIIFERKRLRRCAQVVHASLDVGVSLSTVKRTLKRYGLTKQRSKWARHRMNIPRPFAEKPGDLVQLDTIHVWQRTGGSRVCLHADRRCLSVGICKSISTTNDEIGNSFSQRSAAICSFQFQDASDGSRIRVQQVFS